MDTPAAHVTPDAHGARSVDLEPSPQRKRRDTPTDLRLSADLHLPADLHIPAELAADASAIVAAVEAEQTLNERQRAILDFERQWWSQPGAKEQAIRDRFDVSPTRYYQALNALLDLPQALAYDPTLINRLQRMRTRASAARGRRRLS